MADLHPIFTLADLEVFSAIFAGCSDESPCKWTVDGGDNIRTGTMRRLQYRGDTDVREYEVQISGTAEYFLPITEVARLFRAREFIIKKK